jgi:signal transduction histidine kinase
MTNEATTTAVGRANGTTVPRGLQGRMRAAINWFIPASLLHSRAHRGMARAFVQTHLLGAVAALVMVDHVARVATELDLAFAVLCMLPAVFLALPFVLKATGNLPIVTFTSFQMLAVASLMGTYEYGGFASPFLPWLLVSLMTGLFYQSQRTALVLGVFAIDVAVFFAMLVLRPQASLIPAADLRILSWISIAAAMSYMAYTALYYARVTARRVELQLEADRSRIAAQELEQARAIAEQVNRNRSNFFAKMSHELRTPLNAIIGYSELMLEDAEDNPGAGPQRALDLKRINATGKHLLSLVSDVLDFAQPDVGVPELEVSTFTLGELCGDVTAAAQPLIEANGNRLVVDCPLPQDTIATDPKKLRQILLNLLSNAAKFTRNGTVTLELWIERGGIDDPLHAAVADTGIGIAADVLPKLFEAFVQADPSVYSRFGGTGLGLALTRKFSILLGGQVSATSRPGEGSRFAVDVPAKLRLQGNGVNAVETTEGAPARAAA